MANCSNCSVEPLGVTTVVRWLMVSWVLIGCDVFIYVSVGCCRILNQFVADTLKGVPVNYKYHFPGVVFGSLITGFQTGMSLET